MAMACYFDAIPRSILSGGSVRFFPRVEGNTAPITGAGATPAFFWDFGDGTTSTDATPIHQYPTSASPTSWAVSLTVCDAAGNVATLSSDNFITSEAIGSTATIVNAGFETGDLTGWGSSHTGDGSDATVTVTTGAKQTGTYGCRLWARATNSDESAATVTKILNVASFDEITIPYKINAVPSLGDGENYSLFLSLSVIDSDSEASNIQIGNILNPSVGDWTAFSITKSAIESLMAEISATWPLDGNTTLSIVGGISVSGETEYKEVEIFTDNLNVIKYSAPLLPSTGYLEICVIFENPAATTTPSFMIMNRNPNLTCHMYLQTPKPLMSLDKVGTMTFSVLDLGDSTDTEKAFVAEGINVIAVMGQNVTFSGVIRRVTQNVQAGFDSTSKLKLWDVECDSDLAKLKKIPVNSTALTVSGAKILDSPGYIARRILQPSDTQADIRGIIGCIDHSILYQLNSATQEESAGSMYEHLQKLYGLTNYDLNVRPEVKTFDYVDLSYITGSTSEGSVFVSDGHSNFIGDMFRPGDIIIGLSGSSHPVSMVAYLDHFDTLDFYFIKGVQAGVPTESNGRVLVYRGFKVDFAPDLSPPSSVASFRVNREIFEFNDNDDKKKLATQVVVRGKDVRGVSISVSVAGVHTYDNARQFFNGSTYITRPSEGYIYKNNFMASDARRSATATNPATASFVTSHSSYPTHIIPQSLMSYYVMNARVYFVKGPGTLPSNVSEGVDYYVIFNNGGYIEISTTPGGAAMDIGSDVVGTSYIVTDGGLIVDNHDGKFANGSQFVLAGAVAPQGMILGLTYQNHSPSYSSDVYHIYIGSSIGGGSGTGSGLIIYRPEDVSNSDIGKDPCVWIYGWGYTIPSGSEMAFCIPNSGVAGIPVSSASATSEVVDASGVQFTKVVLSDFAQGDFSGKGFLLNKKLYVDNTDVLMAGFMPGYQQALIGEELVTIDSAGLDPVFGRYIVLSSVVDRVTSPTKKAYPHGVGAMAARTDYTVVSPEPGSPIALHGLYIDDQTVDSNITYGELEAYATAILLGKGTFYPKATGWGIVYEMYVKRVGEYYGINEPTIPSPPRVGDRVTINSFNEGVPAEFEVVSVTINTDEGRVLLELGDFEKNIFTDLHENTSGLNRTLT